MMRGTPNEYVTYNINPSESRERFAEAMHLIRRAWTETRPFGWLGRYYQYRTISIWPRPVQQPHPPLYMSGSSPQAGEFAARNSIGVGFAFTTVPLAKRAVQHNRACAYDAGWEPEAEHVIYRAMFHVADTDEQAFADMSTLPPRISLVDQNKAIAEGVRQSDYYGADSMGQRQRTSRRDLADRIALGQVIVGGPDTVLAQVQRIRDELCAGVLDLVVGAQLGERTLHSIELFGAKVLPRMREL